MTVQMIGRSYDFFSVVHGVGGFVGSVVRPTGIFLLCTLGLCLGPLAWYLHEIQILEGGPEWIVWLLVVLSILGVVITISSDDAGGNNLGAIVIGVNSVIGGVMLAVVALTTLTSGPAYSVGANELRYRISDGHLYYPGERVPRWYLRLPAESIDLAHRASRYVDVTDTAAHSGIPLSIRTTFDLHTQLVRGPALERRIHELVLRRPNGISVNDAFWADNDREFIRAERSISASNSLTLAKGSEYLSARPWLTRTSVTSVNRTISAQ